ncbi:MAG TPA: mercuric transport protein MerTP [Leptospiraceae bacterium]|nr:heavy metal transporter [Spirochaetaceae bacterium]HBS05394.1 mercuric transport protein MerTP [Leptospiraceae bacterium]|tara:strand:- start:2018 stop:2629 length:612 start_codon:yes stop_codon:yes gene_type:complete
MKNKETTSKYMGAGLLSATVASLCCITPVLALISGASGIASAFSWMEPARPYLIGLTVLILGFAWYQQLKPKTAEEIECECDEDGNKPFIQTKKFLGIVTVFAALMLAFPYYSRVFFPSSSNKDLVVVNASDVETVTFAVQGMTCNSCVAHVENEVNKLPGIVAVTASYREGVVRVEFDRARVGLAGIEERINATGYDVVGRR